MGHRREWHPGDDTDGARAQRSRGGRSKQRARPGGFARESDALFPGIFTFARLPETVARGRVIYARPTTAISRAMKPFALVP